MARYKIYLCGDLNTATYENPNPECPNYREHTPCPTGYLEWHQWAERQARDFEQLLCPGCNRYNIWEPK